MILLKALVGSHLHGLNGPDSDKDFKSIEVSPLKEIISPFAKQKNREAIGEDTDECTYELIHFIKLLASCNPTVLETLWAKHRVCPEADKEWNSLANELIENRDKLLDSKKILDSHRGYSTAQLKKMRLDAPYDRTPKTMVAYVRTMIQGIDLLRTGSFEPRIKRYRDELLEIKFSFNSEKHIDLFNSISEKLEIEIAEAYDSCKGFKPDTKWAEDYLLRVYTYGITKDSRVDRSGLYL